MASILVVEDEALIRHLVVDTLTDEGHSVLAAASGEDALARLDGQRPDLMVVDLRMPGMSGQEFVLRQRERGEAIPVLVLSGSSEAKQVGREIGAVAVIHKPFDLDDLVRMVDQATTAAFSHR